MSERNEVEEQPGPRTVDPSDAIGSQSPSSVKKVGKANLRVGSPDFIGGSKSLVNFNNGPIHGDLLNDLTGDINIILGQQKEYLLC